MPSWRWPWPTSSLFDFFASTREEGLQGSTARRRIAAWTTTREETGGEAAATGPAAFLAGRVPTWLPIAAITCLAAVLGMVELGSKSVWFDEASTAWAARLSWSDLAGNVQGSDLNMLLYYGLMKAWRAVAGDSPVALRLPSVLAAAGTVPMLYVLGKRLFGRRVALVAALVLAVNGFVLQYAQTARSYTLVMLLVTAASYWFVRAAEHGQLRHVVLYGATSLLAAYVHILVVLVLAAHAISLALLPRGVRHRGRLLLAVGAAALLGSPPLLLTFARTRPSRYPGGLYLSIDAVKSVAAALAGGGGPLLAVAVGVCVLVTLAAATRRLVAGERSWQAWRLALLVSWLVVPAAAIFVASLAIPMLDFRYFIFVVPPLSLAVGWAVARIRPEEVAAVAVVALVVLSGLGLARWYRAPSYEDWRGAMAIMTAIGRSDDVVVIYSPYWLVPYRYALDHYARDRDPASLPRVVYPPSTWRPFPVNWDWWPDLDEHVRDETSRRDRRVWIYRRVWDDTSRREIAELVRNVQATHRRVPLPPVENLDVRLYEPM